MKYVKIFLLTLLISSPILYFCCIRPSHYQFVSGDLQWNRYYDSRSNFEILSLDDSKGKYLFDNSDLIKSWSLTRWALPNDGYSAKCKLIAVPSKSQFKELFGKDSPQYRVVKNNNEMTIWIATDDPKWNTNSLAKVITEVSLQNFEAKHGKVGLWAHRGMSVLNSDLPNIRQMLGNLNIVFQKDLKIYWSKELLNMTPEVLAKHPIQSSVWFDNEAAAFCLMLYKEYGSQKFVDFLTQSANGPELALANVYGFKSYNDFDIVFKKYMLDISNDITGKGLKITPNAQLTFPIPR